MKRFLPYAMLGLAMTIPVGPAAANFLRILASGELQTKSGPSPLEILPFDPDRLIVNANGIAPFDAFIPAPQDVPPEFANDLVEHTAGADSLVDSFDISFTDGTTDTLLQAIPDGELSIVIGDNLKLSPDGPPVDGWDMVLPIRVINPAAAFPDQLFTASFVLSIITQNNLLNSAQLQQQFSHSDSITSATIKLDRINGDPAAFFEYDVRTDFSISPEPGSLALLALGGLLTARRRRQH